MKVRSLWHQLSRVRMRLNMSHGSTRPVPLKTQNSTPRPLFMGHLLQAVSSDPPAAYSFFLLWTDAQDLCVFMHRKLHVHLHAYDKPYYKNGVNLVRLSNSGNGMQTANDWSRTKWHLIGSQYSQRNRLTLVNENYISSKNFGNLGIEWSCKRSRL